MKAERRTVARYRVKLPIEIEMGGYTIEAATTTEISQLGLRIDCEGAVAGKVLNRYIQVTPGANITANIQIRIPDTVEPNNDIRCRARVISVNRASQIRYIVGLKFLKFEQNCQEVWREYISQLDH